jgi:hypothetical protein
MHDAPKSVVADATFLKFGTSNVSVDACLCWIKKKPVPPAHGKPSRGAALDGLAARDHRVPVAITPHRHRSRHDGPRMSNAR